MSTRSYELVDSQGQLGLSDRRGCTISPVSTAINSVDYASKIPRVISPPPTCRSPPPRIDRLSLRLRSNSGLTLHTNEAILSQYIDYKKDRLMQPPSFNTSIFDPPIDEDEDSLSSVKRTAWTARDSPSRPSFPKSLGDDVFRIGLSHPVVARKFKKYCREQGCEGYLEFLTKVQEYTESTNEMASILTAISTSFIASGATHTLNLSTMVSRALNADVKRIAHTILPGLEAVFLESRSQVERHLATTVFPGFVKSQLTQCMSMALTSNASGMVPSKSEFPGLGESFCIIDASGSILTAVTDSFLTITGYMLEEAVYQSCSFLQGPNIKTILGEGREATELLLTSRHDGSSSWSLCFLYPLRNQKGQLRCWLGAQVDISNFVRSRDDLLRVLDCADCPGLGSDGGSDSRSEQSSGRGITADTKIEKDRSIHSRDSSRSSTSRSRFLQPFRRPSRSHYSSLISESSDYVISTSEYKSTRNKIFSAQRFQPRTQVLTSPTTYSYHILLKCNIPSSRQRIPTPSGTRKKHSLKLHVMFFSEAAADILSIRGDITQMDIFRVLADKAHSPSITKTFKSMIRERVGCGKSTSTEIIVDTNHILNGRRPSTADWDGSKSESHAKHEKKLAKSFKQEKLVSHWTPMRNGDGDFDLVILILTPPA
ncbi:hypothetical protein F4677DRAFT_185341 [Hypoxylon crocopeplum]|nr:hypothetical protein F4677DRAFT_185341 [Hypoxylon crocopeplum]